MSKLINNLENSMKKIVILISGRGSNMQSIIEDCQYYKWPANIVAVISNRPDARGLEYAAMQGIATAVVDHKLYSDRDSFDAALQVAIDQYEPDLVLLAGFMRVLTPAFVEHYQGRILNIHPSLLPAFPGVNTHRQALDAGVWFHGATVHFVTAELDHGPIVLQATVPVLADDTEDVLAARVLKQEHLIYGQAVQWFVENRLKIVNNKVVILPDVHGKATERNERDE